MRQYIFIAAVLVTIITAASCQAEKHHTADCCDTMMLRLDIDNTISEEACQRTLAQLRAYPLSCDEVWFSTGLGIRPLEVHEQHAQHLMNAKEALADLGISYSVQIQMTIGHGGPFGIAEEWIGKTWTGWTGSTGVEDKYCNCPRQSDYLEYIRSMTHIYAATKPKTLWIDDDLRYDNHRPATDGSRIGCWCPTCIADFSAQEGHEWTRETLDAAMATDTLLEQRWKLFSIQSLQQVARVIAQEAHAVSPSTKMGYQKTYFDPDTTVVRTILQTLAEESGQKVSYRLGGGSYYDKYHPVDQIVKSMDAARFMRVLGCPDFVESWCPEIESWPRHYGSRSGQAVLIEGFSALAFGMDAISYFTVDQGEESLEVQYRSMFRPLQEGSETLREYARANKGTQAVGFRAGSDNYSLFDFGMLGIPVLPGVGKSLGTLDNEDLQSVDMFAQTSADIQSFREKLCQEVESPVLCCAPFIGLVLPRISEDGTLKTLGLINCRIDQQECILFQLPNIPANIKKAVWYELRKKPVSLPIVRDEDGTAYVEVPSIAAWNAGFVCF